MALRQLTAPASEPVTRDEAKAFLRLEHDAEDAFIDSLIKTSRLHIEAALSLALITQTWRVTSRTGCLKPMV
ncbi:MAG: head-tail connector protein, partial [Pseudomonadota bacterium]